MGNRFRTAEAVATVLVFLSGMATAAEGDQPRNRKPEERDVELAAACHVLARKNLKLPAECAEFVPAVPKPKPGPKLGPMTAPVRTAQAAAAPAIKTPPPAPTSTPTDGAPGQSFWLLRQDQYDQVSYIFPAEGYQVLQGASVSYSNDQKAKNQSLSTKGFAGYSAYNWTAPNRQNGCGSLEPGPTYLGAYGVGPFLQANGNWTEPMAASEKSALRAGIDTDAYFCKTGGFQQQDLQFLPYGQTDFRGKAGIAGFDALWEPYYINDGVNLGGRLDVLSSKIVGYYFRVLGEANVFRVQDAGLTNFQSRSTYALLGGTGEIRAVLFENDPDVGAFLCGTVSFIGSAKYLFDAVAQKTIHNLGAEIDYRLGGKSASTAHCPTASTANGSTSLSLSYNQGTDPMTYVAQNVYKASLKFSY